MQHFFVWWGQLPVLVYAVACTRCGVWRYFVFDHISKYRFSSKCNGSPKCIPYWTQSCYPELGTRHYFRHISITKSSIFYPSIMTGQWSIVMHDIDYSVLKNPFHTPLPFIWRYLRDGLRSYIFKINFDRTQYRWVWMSRFNLVWTYDSFSFHFLKEKNVSRKKRIFRF